MAASKGFDITNGLSAYGLGKTGESAAAEAAEKRFPPEFRAVWVSTIMASRLSPPAAAVMMFTLWARRGRRAMQLAGGLGSGSQI